MKRMLPLFGIAILLAAVPFAAADEPRPVDAMYDPAIGHGDGGATGFCSVAFYDYCSGWTWIWHDWFPDDEVGVIFDLPADCGKEPGAECVNTHF